MKRSETRRNAIVEAMIRVAGDKGYIATSVADVIAAAGVSRTTFYKHFDNKQDCFLAAQGLAIERILGAAEGACEAVSEWPDRARGGLSAIVELLSSDPPLARTAIVEVSAAGTEARRQHGMATARVARLLESGQPRRQHRLPANTALMAVGAVVGLIFDELRTGQAANLPQILPELQFALLVPYLGPRVAAEAYAAPA